MKAIFSQFISYAILVPSFYGVNILQVILGIVECQGILWLVMLEFAQCHKIYSIKVFTVLE
ncbi:hypothetical protein H1P_110013 [Hyella patelloides LEGE 07179]|uniref:Uncharacterized protein n=1 Tax=Hyella patelloides LEGE 07179 TaxID=945734 RepID=A0A563VJK8_9CYAN|nr:hypothetical protein H1P_110013 [Hyella patelloides LEGE 07179]